MPNYIITKHANNNQEWVNKFETDDYKSIFRASSTSKQQIKIRICKWIWFKENYLLTDSKYIGNTDKVNVYTIIRILFTTIRSL